MTYIYWPLYVFVIVRLCVRDCSVVCSLLFGCVFVIVRLWVRYFSVVGLFLYWYNWEYIIVKTLFIIKYIISFDSHTRYYWLFPNNLYNILLLPDTTKVLLRWPFSDLWTFNLYLWTTLTCNLELRMSRTTLVLSQSSTVSRAIGSWILMLSKYPTYLSFTVMLGEASRNSSCGVI